MTSHRLVSYLAIGQIQNEFIIDLDGKVSTTLIGGPVIYTAAGLKHWGVPVGVISVVGSDFSDNSIGVLQEHGLDTQGIKRLSQNIDLRSFFAYISKEKCLRENPVAVFSSMGLPFPKELLGYEYIENKEGWGKLPDLSKALLTDLPREYLDAIAAHISPLDLTSQIQLSTLMLKGSVRTITIQPHPTFMTPANFNDFAVLVKDSTAIITGENELRSLFHLRSNDIWQIMEEVAGFGCSFVLADQGSKGFKFFDATNGTKYHVPRYPARVIDPTGEIDVFCGGFLAGFQTYYDPLRAVIQASATASLAVESIGALTLDESLPGLDLARMEVIQNMTTRL